MTRPGKFRYRSLLRPSQHPTGEQAAQSLRQGECLYAAVSVCSGRAGSVGLAREDDVDAVLVCKAHFGRLRRIGEVELARLRRHLHSAFNRNPFVA